MTSKPQIFGNESDDNLFSKVLSGMKSVFNNSSKSKIKKLPSSDNVTTEIQQIDLPNKPSIVESVSVETEIVDNNVNKNDIPQTSLNNMAVIENVLGINEFLPVSQLHDDNAVSAENLMPKFNVDSLDISYQEADRNSYENQNVASVAQEDAFKNVSDNNSTDEIIMSFEDFSNTEQEPILISLEEKSNIEHLEDQQIDKFPIKSLDTHKTKNVSKRKLKSKNKTDETPDTEDVSLVSDVLPKDELKDNTEALQNKPRIVLKFRSEKSGPRSTNMKIISNNEKSDDDSTAVINRRSLRGRLPIISEDNPIDDIKIQIDLQQIETKPAINVNNESNDLMKTPPSRKTKRNNNINTDSNSEDSPPLEKNAIKRSARRRSKEFSENVLANAIARKEKIYNETSPSQTRLSRRIKPTAKILANRELRLGLETQNNARLGLILEKNQDDCKMTRSSSRKVSEKMKTEVSLLKNQQEKPKMKRQLKPSSDKKSQIKMECENNEDGQARIEIVHSAFADVGNKTSDKKVKKTKRPITVNSDNPEENEYRRLNRLKKKHLKKLGLKAVSDNKNHSFRDSDIVSDESTMDSTNTEAIIEHLNTRDQNLYLSNEGFSNEIDESCKTEDSINIDNQLEMSDMKNQKNGKQTKRKIDHFDSEDSISSEKNDTTKRNTYEESTFRITRKRFKMKGSTDNIDSETLANQETNSNRIKKKSNNHNNIDSINRMSCLCDKQSNIFAESNSVSDPEFCRAIENIGGRYIGCGRVINSTQLVRAGSRAPFFLSCDLHRSRLSMHHCCAGCGVFCTQGVHYQCSEGHLFHWECSLPFVPLLIAFGSDGSSSADQPAPPKGTITDLYNAEPGCPHCGLNPATLEPVNLDCFKVNLEMSCSNPVIFLPNPRLQWVPARMSFSSNPKPIDDVIDDDTSMSILPQETLDALKNYFLSNISANENMFDEFGKESEPDFDLIEAVCDSQNTIKRILSALKSGANICRRISSMSDGTFLHLAVKELNLCALHIFRMLGLELDAFDKEQRTPLILAVMSYDDEVQTKNYSDVKNESDTENNLDESKNDIIGNTIVYRQIVDYLIKGGSDPTLKGPHGASVLHFAAKYGDIATCTSLLNLNICKVRSFVNQQDDAGLTPLIWAVESKHIAVARLLLEHGANAISRDFENNTPLHWAASSGCKTILEDLLNHESEVNVINVNGDTPLHFCARYDHYCCLIILLARGAAINVKNLDGEMAIDCVDDDTSECYSTLAINEQLQNIINPPIRDEKIISNDVSNGKESNPIKCVNSVDDEDLTGKFTYITKNCYTVDVNIDRKITSMQVCDCKDGCGQTNALCTCTNVSMQSWYDVSGKLVQYFDYDDPPMIFECNDICSCNKSQCVNRGIEKGSFVSLKVFRQTESSARGGGWGVCTIQPILKGSFVCEYVGEILPGSLAYHRTDDSYLFELETKGDILEENVEPYCIDAKNYGNVSRFINHKCEPNIVPVRVFVNHRDLRFPRIAFFASRDISSGEELGFDYGEKFWTIKSKSFGCNCGSAKCRYSHVDEDEDN